MREAARVLIDRFGSFGPDLSALTVLLPSRLSVAAFARALAEIGAYQVLLLPRLTTLADLAASTTCEPSLWTDSARELVLYEQLRGREWFDDADLWAAAAELRQLSDELTRSRAALPHTLGEFTAQLEAAYCRKAGTPMEMEAQLVHEAWRAMVRDRGDLVDAVTRYHLQLARLADCAAGPLVTVGLERLSTAEKEFLEAYASRQRVLLIAADAQLASEDPVVRGLCAAWPGPAAGAASLRERAATLKVQGSPGLLAARVQFVGAASLEDEARAADGRVRGWLAEGRQRIAVVVQDRLVARRLRALLERAQVLVQDETGWTLSTVAAATVVMRFLDCLANDFYHRDLLDLLKSPFVFSDWGADARKSAAYGLERMTRRDSVIAGLSSFLEATRSDPEVGYAVTALERLQDAALCMFPRRDATVSTWLKRLHDALGLLGVPGGLGEDAAGLQLLELLERLQQELGEGGPQVGFLEWRRWLDSQLERETFRDRDVSSPVVFTHLAATALREFDGAILLGCDARQFPGGSGNTVFFNQSVRRQLRLRVRADEIEEVRRHLIGLLAATPQVLVTWQAQVDGEPNLISPFFEMLQAVNALAFGDDLRAAHAPHPILAAQVASEAPGVGPAPMMAPPMPSSADRVPRRVSVSAWGSLVACPYQFFGRHMLKLNELDEVREAVEKKDYGAVVHDVLRRFHSLHPQVTGANRDLLEHDLAAISDETFAPLVARNYLATGWLMRWKTLISLYLDWQSARESDGWRFVAGEEERELELTLEGGNLLTLYGRLDRLDQREAEHGPEYAVLDYKTQSKRVLLDKLRQPGEDVQLVAYALLQEGVVQAAYLSLDKESVAAVPPGTGPSQLAATEHARIAATFSRLLGGAGLPAQGDTATCSRCEMRPLCRRDYWG